MNKPTQLAFLAILFAYGFWSGEWLHAKWVPLTVFGTACFLIPVWKINRLAAVALFYSISNGLVNALSEFSIYANSTDLAQTILRVQSLSAVVFLICIVAIVMNYENVRFIAQYIWTVCIIAAVISVASFAAGGWPVLVGPYQNISTVVGPSFNKSLSATLIAITFPFLLERFKIDSWKSALIFLFPIAAIVYLGSAIGFAAIVACLAAYWFAETKQFITAIVGATAVAFAGFLFYGQDLFNFSGRLPVWKAAIDLIIAHPEKSITGFGLGTAYVYGYSITQSMSLPDPRIFLSLHNDWLQTRFELGLVGFGLWSAFFISSAIEAFKTPWLFAALATIAVAAFGNFPARMALEALIIAIVFARVWRQDESRN